jgi:DNA polymerase-4
MDNSASTRTIVHLDLDSFFVSVERLLNPKLIGKPVIIGGTSGRGVVSCCSYEARKMGVTSAMPSYRAKQLCPEGIFISGNMTGYSQYSRLVTEIIEAQAPLFEKASVDEFYVDISGLEKYVGTVKWATELRKKVIKESGLPISMGVGSNKMIAKIATGESKPNGQLFIESGKELEFLSPLDIEKLPMVGDKMQLSLENIGIRKVGVLQKMPLSLLKNKFGKHGEALWYKARGIDASLVSPYHDPKSVSTEDTFHKNLTDTQAMKSMLAAMVEKIAFEMRSEKKLTGCLTVKVRYNDFSTHSKQCHFSYHADDATLIKQALSLFDKLYESGRPVRLIGVRLSNLVPLTHQMNLFEDREKSIRLATALDKVKINFGSKAVTRAFSM